MVRGLLILSLVQSGCAEGVLVATKEATPTSPLTPGGVIPPLERFTTPSAREPEEGQPPPAPEPDVKRVQLLLSEPGRGARVTGPTLTVAGQVHNATSPTVTVDGEPVDVDPDGSFSIDLPVEPGLFTLETLVEDANGRAQDLRAALVDADADETAPVEEAVQVVVSRQGFAELGKLITPALANLDIGSLLGQGGAALGDGVEVRSITYDRVEVALAPEAGALELRLRLYGLRIEIVGEVDLLVAPVRLSGSASSNPAEIIARLALEVTPAGGLDIQIANAEAALHDFELDLDGVPGFIEDLVDNLVREFAEDKIGEAIRDFVVPKLFDPNALSREIEVLGTSLKLDLQLRDIALDPWAMTIDVAAAAEASEVVHAGGAVRPFGGQPTRGADADATDLDLALGADFVSRILHAAWAGGVLDFSLEEGAGVELPIQLTVGVLANALGEAARGIDPTESLLLRTRALLPPVASVVPGDHPLVVEIGDLMLELATIDEPLVSVALQLTMSVGLSTDENGDLQPDIQVDTRADVAETPRGRVEDAMLENQIGAFAALLPTALAGDAAAGGDDPLPVAIPLAGARFEADPLAPFLHMLVDLGP